MCAFSLLVVPYFVYFFFFRTGCSFFNCFVKIYVHSWNIHKTQFDLHPHFAIALNKIPAGGGHTWDRAHPLWHGVSVDVRRRRHHSQLFHAKQPVGLVGCFW